MDDDRRTARRRSRDGDRSRDRDGGRRRNRDRARDRDNGSASPPSRKRPTSSGLYTNPYLKQEAPPKRARVLYDSEDEAEREESDHDYEPEPRRSGSKSRGSRGASSAQSRSSQRAEQPEPPPPPQSSRPKPLTPRSAMAARLIAHNSSAASILPQSTRDRLSRSGGGASASTEPSAAPAAAPVQRKRPGARRVRDYARESREAEDRAAVRNARAEHAGSAHKFVGLQSLMQMAANSAKNGLIRPLESGPSSASGSAAGGPRAPRAPQLQQQQQGGPRRAPAQAPRKRVASIDIYRMATTTKESRAREERDRLAAERRREEEQRRVEHYYAEERAASRTRLQEATVAWQKDTLAERVREDVKIIHTEYYVFKDVKDKDSVLDKLGLKLKPVGSDEMSTKVMHVEVIDDDY